MRIEEAFQDKHAVWSHKNIHEIFWVGARRDEVKVLQIVDASCNKLEWPFKSCTQSTVYNQIEVQMSKNPILSQIKKRIEEAKKEDPDVAQLDLSEITITHFTPDICLPIEKLKNLEILYLTGCGLKTLEGFPKCKFVALDLSRNEISDSSKLEVLLSYPELTQIILSENKVERLETVLQLQSLSKLVEIDFEGNPVSSIANYRESVFDKFALIEVVDRKDKEGNDVPEEDGDLDVDEDDDEDDYDEEEEDDEFDEDDYESEESEPKKKKGGNKKK